MSWELGLWHQFRYSKEPRESRHTMQELFVHFKPCRYAFLYTLGLSLMKITFLIHPYKFHEYVEGTLRRPSHPFLFIQEALCMVHSLLSIVWEVAFSCFVRMFDLAAPTSLELHVRVLWMVSHLCTLLLYPDFGKSKIACAHTYYKL